MSFLSCEVLRPMQASRSRSQSPGLVQIWLLVCVLGLSGPVPPAFASCVNPPSGLVSWWPGEGNALDSFSGNHGTLVNGPSFTAGEVGQAFRFNAANQEVRIAASQSTDVGPANGLTFEAWIRPNNLVNQYPIAEWNDGVNFGAHFWINVAFSGLGGPGCLFVNLRDTSFNSHYYFSSTGLVSASTWQHVAMTYDRYSGVSKLFVNGTAVVTVNLGSFVPLTSDDLHLGYRPGFGSYSGLLDEPALYNRALSDAEIQSIYAAGVSGKCSVLPLGTATILFEGFEGAFPEQNNWSVGDANATGIPAYWDDVNGDFGGEGAHSGNWKGYCAGVGNGGDAINPRYQDFMQAYMTRTIDLRGFAYANLRFWHKVPSIETGYDYARVYIDGVQVFSTTTPVADWTQVIFNLNGYVGSTHTVNFEFDSDYSNEGEGWYLDDIRVSGGETITGDTVEQLFVSNYTGFVIDADGHTNNPAYNRDTIQANAQVRSENFGGAPANDTYTLRYRLLDAATGRPFPIYDAGGATNSSYTYNISNSVALAAFDSVTVTNVAAIRPAARLNPATGYTVELSIYRGGVFTGQSSSYGPLSFFHFTNLLSSDAAFNVIGMLNNAGFDSTYAIATSPTQSGFPVDAGYYLLRYDGFAGPIPPTDPVTVYFNFQLLDQNSNSVPLVSNQTNFVRSIAGYVPGVPPSPTVMFQSDTFILVPAVPLDSVSNRYTAVVTISHVDVPLRPAVIENSRDTGLTQLMYFNGHLWFGDVDTIFTHLANTPAPGIVSGTNIATELAVDLNSGHLLSRPSYTYGSGAVLPVNLNQQGAAYLPFGVTNYVVVNSPVPDYDSAGGIRFARLDPIDLFYGGAFVSHLRLFLPTGMGYGSNTTTRFVKGTVDFVEQFLTPSLQPISPPAFNGDFGPPFYVCHEKQPLWVEANSLTWDVPGGRLLVNPTGYAKHVRKDAYDSLTTNAPAMAFASLANKRSNDKYYHFVNQVTTPQVIVTADGTGTAAVTMDCVVAASGSFTAHFPYDVPVQWTAGGRVRLVNGQIVTPDSHLDGVAPVNLAYSQDCQDTNCPGGGGSIGVALAPAGSQLLLTRDGGLLAAGAITVPTTLAWGYINSLGDYAQKSMTFGDGCYHMPGHFLRGTENPLSGRHGPGVILFSGIACSNLNVIERPGTAPYADGFADYAGINFRCLTDGAKSGRSVLTGQPVGPYPLTGRSKYYVRKGGVSGIHEAVFHMFPTSAMLFGYHVNFSNYGLAYLDSENIDSRTEGSIDIPYPSAFTQEFAELKFTCLGAMKNAKVPSSSGNKVLVYWLGDFKTLAIQFVQKPADLCDPSKGNLALGVQAWASHVPDPLYGTLGFQSDGNLIPLSFGIPGLDSRLKLPTKLSLRGPKSETYALTPTCDAYYNNWDYRANAGSNGWVNWGATIDVPFFEDLKVHVQTSAQASNTTAPIYLMGGWPANGWETSPGVNFFTTKYFDPDNAGFPTGSPVAGYRNNPGDFGHPRAQRTWLGVVPFDYPLNWSSATRSFSSTHNVTSSLLVLEVQHQIKYMSAQNVDVTFGAEYTGLPKINLASLGYNLLSEATGVETAISNAVGQVIGATLEKGLGSFDTILKDQVDGLFDGIIDNLTEPVLHSLYTELASAYGMPGDFKTNATAILNKYFFAGSSTLQNQLHQIGGVASNGITPATGLFKKLDDSLGDVERTIDSIIGTVNTDPNTGLPTPDYDGLLKPVGGDGSRTGAEKLIGELIKQLAPAFATDQVSSQIKPLLKEVEPALQEISSALTEVRGSVHEVRGKLKLGGDFANEVTTKINSSLGAVDAAITSAQNEVDNFFQAYDYATGSPMAQMTEQQFKDMVRRKLKDQIYGTVLAATVNQMVKERVYDLDAALRESLDSVFQQVNGVIRNAIGQTLSQLDNTINGLTGGLGDSIGAAKLQGYAHINGDSLKLLRIDGHFQFKSPESLEFNAYLQIKELDSLGSPGCSHGADSFTEVTLGATDVDLDWISPDLKIDVGTKFTFQGNSLVGLAGAFRMKGEVDFEGFAIKQFAVAVAFGVNENYLSAALRMEFDRHEVAGGVFFGRTCTLDPIALWAPDVASVLGAPPFTGGYVYGEAWIPLEELLGIPASCVLDLRAGLGAGIFYFVEGPTYGGKMLMGVDGEVLCIFSVGAQISLIGLRHGDDLILNGNGNFSASAGPCPFCIKLSKDVHVTYKNSLAHPGAGDWNFDF